MKKWGWFGNPKNRLAPIAGCCDGILTALILAGGRMLDSKAPIVLGLVATALSGLFAFFVAHYAQLRGELFEAERQLNLTTHGRLARSHLGRAVFCESVSHAMLGATCSFCGAVLPLSVSICAPALPWVAIPAALAALGALLALTVGGWPPVWSGGLVLGGGILAYIGTRLQLI